MGLKEIEYGTYTCIQYRTFHPPFDCTRIHSQMNIQEWFDVCEGFHQSSTVTLDSVKIHVQNETSPCQKQYLKTKTWRCSTPICNTTNQLCHLQKRSQCAVYLPNPHLAKTSRAFERLSETTEWSNSTSQVKRTHSS